MKAIARLVKRIQQRAIERQAVTYVSVDASRAKRPPREGATKIIESAAATL